MSDLVNQWGLHFHHLGLAVQAPDVAERFLAGLGYRIDPLIHDPLQNVRVGMCLHASMPEVEIICPAGKNGPLDKVLKLPYEGLIYHICYVSRNVQASLDAMESQGGLRLFCFSPPKPAVLFGGLPVSFYFVHGMGLIEILEHPRLDV